MGYSDDTAEFMAFGSPAPYRRETIAVQYCAALSGDEMTNEKLHHESKGWTDVRVIEAPHGEWRTYTWSGIREAANA